MNPLVSDFIKNAPEDQRQIMEMLREIIHRSVPAAIEEFKWSRPVFRTAQDFAYLKTSKAHVTLGFFSDKLKDEKGRIQGTGKNMKHIKIRKIEDVEPEMFGEWFKILAH
jgi:hypothetical protein